MIREAQEAGQVANRAGRPAIEPQQEQRQARRSSLMMRTAKLVCQSGEYVCVVRDVSSGGVRLHFYHPVPAEGRVFLVLANGLTYPVERVWEREGAAGYRFVSEVDLPAFISEPGRYPHRGIRLALERPALVTTGGIDSRAMLADISTRGARVVGGSRYAAGSLVRLEVEGLPVRFGHVCWRNDHDHGIIFQEAIPLDRLARLLFELQPCIAEPEDEAAANRAA